MLSTRSHNTKPSQKFLSTVKFATRILLIVTPVLFAVALLSVPFHPVHAGTGSLSIGTMHALDPAPCPGTGWFYYTDPNTGTTYNATCQGATIDQCSNAVSLGFTFGVLSPSVAFLGNVKGVIVFFNGGDGTSPAGDATGTGSSEFNMANYYFTQGYEIVQLAWNSPWQQTDAVNSPGSPNPGNVQNGACRPATFLNYVYNNIYLPITQGGNNTAGMCAQGASAGSAQIAYSLAYYGAGSYLDNVELISGPVLADIKQGCQEPPPVNVTICPSGQFGCPPPSQGGASWSLPPTYLSGANAGVGKWTYDSSCGVPAPVTTQTSEINWLKQSIVDQYNITGLGASPSYSYKITGMSAWLCRTLQNQQTALNCSQHYSQYQEECPNNSSPEGEIFYSQILSTSPPRNYGVYPVDLCGGPEGAPSTVSNVPGYLPLEFNGTISGFNAITFDMAGTPPGASLPVSAQCIHNVQQ